MKLENLFEKIEKENASFKKLSKSQKRVVVAQDCLARIECNQFKVARGQVIDTGKDLRIADSVKTFINTNTKFTCSACAKGSLFLSFIGRTNQFQGHEFEGINSLRSIEHKKLLEIFTIKQLSLIETAFEGVQYLVDDNNFKRITFNQTTKENLYKFWENLGIKLNERFKNLKGSSVFQGNIKNIDFNNLLAKICENIIENKGTFKP